MYASTGSRPTEEVQARATGWAKVRSLRAGAPTPRDEHKWPHRKLVAAVFRYRFVEERIGAYECCGNVVVRGAQSCYYGIGTCFSSSPRRFASCQSSIGTAV